MTQTNKPLIELRIADWLADGTDIQDIRTQVFIEEQNVPEEEEMDEHDPASQHFLVIVDGKPAATGRLLASGQIGRMAVLKSHRGLGLGGKMLSYIVAHALQEDYPNAFLHAQTHAIGFYERYGFVASGEEFMDAGIPHRHMDYHS